MPTYSFYYRWYPGSCRCQAEYPLSTSYSYGALTQCWTSSRVTVEPPEEPITLADIKNDRRVTHSDDDVLLQSLIQAAREWCEGWTETSIVEQTRETILPYYEEDVTYLPYGPVQEVLSATGTGPYTVTYLVGYPDDAGDYQANIPQSFVTAIKLLVGDWYENRENTIVGTTVGGTLEIAVKALLARYRKRLGIA